MSNIALRASQRVISRSRALPASRSNTTNMFPFEVWPLFVVIGAGCGLCAFANFRFAFYSPDLKWSKARRSEIAHESHASQYGINWGSHQQGWAVNEGTSWGYSEVTTPDRQSLETKHNIFN